MGRRAVPGLMEGAGNSPLCRVVDPFSTSPVGGTMGSIAQDLKRAVNEWLEADNDLVFMIADEPDGGIKVFESHHMAYSKLLTQGVFCMRMREVRDPLMRALVMAMNERMLEKERANGSAGTN